MQFQKKLALPILNVFLPFSVFTHRNQNKHFQQNKLLMLSSNILLHWPKQWPAAASMTYEYERGFHINPKNFRTLLSCKNNKSSTKKLKLQLRTNFQLKVGAAFLKVL